MVTKWYINRQFTHLKLEGEKGFGIPSARQLVDVAHLQRLIFTSLEFFYDGEPVVRQFFAVEDQTMTTKEHVLGIAASLARSSKNPAIYAVAKMAFEAGQPVREVEVDAVSTFGVTAKLDRAWYVLGDEEAMGFEAIELGVAIQALARQFEKEGKYVLFLAQRQPKRLLGIFACEYPVNPEAQEHMKVLESLGLEIILLSGAKTALARGVGKKIGISLVHSELSNADKQEIIQDLCTQQPASGIVVPSKCSLQAPLRIVIKNGVSKNEVTAENIDKLSHLISTAQKMIEKVRKRLFWAKL